MFPTKHCFEKYTEIKIGHLVRKRDMMGQSYRIDAGLYHREHTILLSRERVIKGTKRMNSLPFRPTVLRSWGLFLQAPGNYRAR